LIVIRQEQINVGGRRKTIWIIIGILSPDGSRSKNSRHGDSSSIMEHGITTTTFVVVANTNTAIILNDLLLKYHNTLLFLGRHFFVDNNLDKFL